MTKSEESLKKEIASVRKALVTRLERADRYARTLEVLMKGKRRPTAEIEELSAVAKYLRSEAKYLRKRLREIDKR